MDCLFDVLVIGGGHAGTEAAFAAAKMGCSTALVTLSASRIGLMSCNPAMGGLAKGQLVKEIDAMGGLMGRITDLNAIQYRLLNSSKGPAVRSSRAQCDKNRYAKTMQEFLKHVPNLQVIEAEMTGLISETEGGKTKVSGIYLKDGSKLFARSVVITSGTFLKAIMHMGEVQTEGGRVGDPSSNFLSRDLESLGFRLRRLKTGTPPRLHKKSINFDKLEPQPGDLHPRPFSMYFRPDPFPYLDQLNCFITYTNPQTHEIINKNLMRSPMYSGTITGIGPRYCPSIEDKIVRFADKERHQIFLEPEGLDVDEVYVNGVSTSLPQDVQENFIRSIDGLENAQFIRYGYAVEYDSIDARQLGATLGSKEVEGLYLAGQVNGTSGYEEAGAQGLVAGINAAQHSKGREPVTFGRDAGYLGVLIDDLILKGSDEPYRMFTSRAEFRLLLREDNADLRLSPKAIELGLLGEAEAAIFEEKKKGIETLRGLCESTFIKPVDSVNSVMERRSQSTLKDRASVSTLLKRPGVSWDFLEELGFVEWKEFDLAVQEQVEIQIRYQGYIDRDLQILAGVRKSEGTKIPVDLDYKLVEGLSNEVRGRLEEVKPETIGQASRIQGVTPAAVANLLIYVKTRTKQRPFRKIKRPKNLLRKAAIEKGTFQNEKSV